MNDIKSSQLEVLRLNLTESAQEHFRSLIKNESPSEPLNLRLLVLNPCTQAADINITFCPIGAEAETDIALQFVDFMLYIDLYSIAALQDAVIDYKRDTMGGQLSIKAPHIRGSAPVADAPLRERVQYVIDSEINPNLAAHRGFVSLVDIVDNFTVVLRFGGGCHGCGMADVTLKSGIERTLMQRCPDIVAVKDDTDHTQGTNPYF